MHELCDAVQENIITRVCVFDCEKCGQEAPVYSTVVF